jgi:hypothetical protein
MRHIIAALLLLATPALAQRFEMQPPQPAFAGARFGNTGAYEILRGQAVIALDPAAPGNAIIADLDRAPRNAQGRVEAAIDIHILRPVDAARGNGSMIVEAVNRGRPLIAQLFNDTAAARLGRTETESDAGNAWLFRQGYTVVLLGWQGDNTAEAGLHMRAPHVPGITGQVRDEFVFDNTTSPIAARLTYPLAEPYRIAITARARQADARVTRPDLSLHVAGPDRIEITRPAELPPGTIFEVIYTARDPIVLGMGFAGYRDIPAALRHGEGEANPMAGRAPGRAIAFGISQSGRFLRDFLYQGFNQDLSGRPVYDAMIPHIAGSRRTDTNARWAQPGRNPSDHTDRLYPADQFPFTYAETADPLTGRRDSLLRACMASRSCPRIFQTDSEFEFWGARGSLTLHDPAGHHIELPQHVRAYMFSGHPHFAPADAWAAQGRLCAMPTNPLQAGAPMRALLVALESWMREGVEPPTSRVPTLAAGTLVPPGSWPAIPGLVRPTSLTPAPLLDTSVMPPRVTGEYRFFVPRLDADGHAIGGIRLPVIEAARASYLGFNPRAAGFGEGALCTNQGAALPIPATRHAGDPRMPLAERFADNAAYLAAVRNAAARLVTERLLLEEDAAAMLAAAQAGTLARLR